jgi:hypothetical protein
VCPTLGFGVSDNECLGSAVIVLVYYESDLVTRNAQRILLGNLMESSQLEVC